MPGKLRKKPVRTYPLEVLRRIEMFENQQQQIIESLAASIKRDRGDNTAIRTWKRLYMDIEEEKTRLLRRGIRS